MKMYWKDSLPDHHSNMRKQCRSPSQEVDEEKIPEASGVFIHITSLRKNSEAKW